MPPEPTSISRLSASGFAIGVHGEGANLLVQKVTVLHAAHSGIRVSGPDGRVVKCVVESADYGVNATGDRATVEKCAVRATATYGIFAAAASA